jgi:hypothetical protein
MKPANPHARRRPQSSRRHGVKGFGLLVAILSAGMFLGVLGLLTPGKLGGTHYPNCTAARAADAAPLRRGEPGYRPRLDRDGDGIACEPWNG